MSIEAILAGVGVAIVVIAYVMRPFRQSSDEVDLDLAIEAWIAELGAEAGAVQPGRDETESGTGSHTQNEGGNPAAGVINYCSQCGQSVSSEDRYCSGCGYRLGGGGT